ncbi:hypothetical protein Tco_0280518 [Tanacetum coccineum]
MCERHEANYIQSEGNKDQNSHDLFSRKSHHDPNNSEKELKNDVKNDLKDFKRRIRSMRTDYDKLYDKDDRKTTGVLPNIESKTINQEPRSKIDFEKSITKFLDGQRVTNMSDPPPSQAHTEYMNAVFIESEKSDDSSKTQKDPPPPIIVNNKIEKDKPIKTSIKGYHVVTTNEYPFCEHTMDTSKAFAQDEGCVVPVLDSILFPTTEFNGNAKKNVRLMMEKLFGIELELILVTQSNAVEESTVRRDLQLEDAEGIDCLPNSTIFEELTRMSSKITTWNEFSSTIASAIICLATNQKFNFLKYIFESMVRNLDIVSGIVTDEAIHKELGDRLVRAATTASSLEAEQDSGNITKTRSKATHNESSSLRTLQVVVPGVKKPWGILLFKLAINGTMSNLQQRVLDLEKTKTTQQNEIASLKRRVKKLEQKKRLRTHGLKRLHKVGMSRRMVSSGSEEDLGEDSSKQGRRINAIDADQDITLVNVQDNVDNEMFNADTLNDDEVFPEQEVAAKGDVIEEPSVPVSADSASTKVSTVSALKKVSAASASTKVSAATILTPRKGIVITELGTPTIMRSSQQPSHAEVQDKGKGKMIEPKPVMPMKKDVQIMIDEEAAKNLQSEFDEEERLAREKDEANVALTEELDDIQATIEADHELA